MTGLQTVRAMVSGVLFHFTEWTTVAALDWWGGRAECRVVFGYERWLDPDAFLHYAPDVLI